MKSALGVILLFLASNLLAAETSVPATPKVIYLGESQNGYYAIIDAGTAKGFSPGNKACIYDVVSSTPLYCSEVILAKRHAAALKLSFKQFKQTIPQMQARLEERPSETLEASKEPSKSTQKSPASAGSLIAKERKFERKVVEQDNLELVPGLFSRDGRTAAEIAKIEMALDRAEAHEKALAQTPEGQNENNASTEPFRDREKFNSHSTAFLPVASNINPYRLAHRKLSFGLDAALISAFQWTSLAENDGAKKTNQSLFGISAGYESPFSPNLALLVKAKAHFHQKTTSTYQIPNASTSTATSTAWDAGPEVKLNWIAANRGFFRQGFGIGFDLIRSEVKTKISAADHSLALNPTQTIVSTASTNATYTSASTALVPNVNALSEWQIGYFAANIGLSVGFPLGLAHSHTANQDSSNSNDEESIFNAVNHRPNSISLSLLLGSSLLL